MKFSLYLASPNTKEKGNTFRVPFLFDENAD